MLGVIGFFLLISLLVIFALVERLVQMMITSMKQKSEIEFRKGQIQELREQVRALKEDKKEVEILPL